MHLNDAFGVEEVTIGPDGLVTGTVIWGFPEVVAEQNAAHWAKVKVRVEATPDTTIAQLHQLLFAQAVKVVGMALANSEGKSAEQMFHDTVAADKAERESAERERQEFIANIGKDAP